MYHVIILSPTKEEREAMYKKGITAICINMVEKMTFVTVNDAKIYMDEIIALYYEIRICYTIEK